MGLPFIIGALVLATGTETQRAAPWQLLSGNAGHPQAVDLGLTYSYPSPPTNPADEGRRLLDNDAPNDDWNNVVGFNYADKSVEFQWPQPQRVVKVRLRMADPRRPRKVEISGRLDPSQPWRLLGEIVPAEQNGWFELRLKQPQKVREVRLDLRLKEWGFYLHEVQFWGIPGYAHEGPVTAERAGEKLVLARGGKPHATIVVAKDASEKVRAAASLLQNTLFRISGAGLPIVTDDRKPTGPLLLVGPSAQTAAMGIRVEQGSYPVQEQSIARRDDQRIALLGNDAGTYEGTRRAVYLFLETLGCGWYAPNARWTVLPKTDAPAVGALDRKLIPAFNSRAIEWPWPAGAFDPSAWGLGGTGVFHSHIFSAIVPKDDKTFREHPDWFAMVNGKRQKSQLSFTNPEVVDLAAQSAREFFARLPAFATFSLSPDDEGGFDESPEAQALDVNPGGRTLAFANAVAGKLRQSNPGKEVIFYAYWFTKAAPTRVKAAPGVNVMMINDTCQAHAMDDPSCPTNREWQAQFAGWQRTGAKMSAYEWYVPAATDPRWGTIPFLPGEVALRDLRFYQGQGIRWMVYESLNNERIDNFPLRWPLYYVAARGMENPKLSFEQIMSLACQRLFGPAAPSMQAFYAELSRALQASQAHPGNWTPPNPRHLYPPTVQTRLKRFLAEATNQAKRPSTDPAIPARVADVQNAWSRAEAAIGHFPE